MKTLLLVQDEWDVCLDSSGNWALATEPYALAQDVASAIKLFLGELYYNTKKGIPYWTEILGFLPPSSLIVQLMQDAALTVPDVVSAICSLTSYNDRDLTGQVAFKDVSGVTTVVSF